jgi:hypothetical protein
MIILFNYNTYVNVYLQNNNLNFFKNITIKS